MAKNFMLFHITETKNNIHACIWLLCYVLRYLAGYLGFCALYFGEWQSNAAVMSNAAVIAE